MASERSRGYVLGAVAAASYGLNPLFALPLYGAGMGVDSVLFFRYLLAVVMLAGPAGPGFSHLTVHFVSRGIPSASVAWLMTYLGIVLIFGKIFCGFLTDWLGGYRSNFIIGGALLGGMLLCSLSRSASLILPAAAMTLLGAGLPMSSVSPVA